MNMLNIRFFLLLLVLIPRLIFKKFVDWQKKYFTFAIPTLG